MSKQPIGRVQLRNVRLAFPHLFDPQAGIDGGKPKFNSTFIIADDATISAVDKVIEEVAKEKWKGKAGDILDGLRKKDRVCLRDGDDKAQYDGFADAMYISASTATRPTVLDADKTPLTERDGRPYAGCYVNASIEVWAQDNSYGKRINAQLRGVQFFRDGDAFSAGGAASEDEFEDVSDGADADDFA